MWLCRRRIALFLAGLCAVLFFQGCASTGDRTVNILYRPAAEARGGTGTVYLVQGVQPAPTEAPSGRWVLGQVRKEERKEIGRVVTGIPPAGLVLDALSLELSNAGYRVITVKTLPPEADRGIVLTDVALSLDDKHSYLKDEASCSAKMGLQQWRRGTALRNLQYQADYSETAVTERDRLPAQVLQKTLQLLMTRSVPDLVRAMEGT